MNPIKKIEFRDWYLKIDLPIRKAADFECNNIPVNDPKRKPSDGSKPIRVGYNKVKIYKL